MNNRVLSQNTKFEPSNIQGLKNGSHNDTKLCVISHCVHTSIYNQSTYMMHKCDESQHEDRTGFHLKISNNAFSQSDFNNNVLKFQCVLWQKRNL